MEFVKASYILGGDELYALMKHCSKDPQNIIARLYHEDRFRSYQPDEAYKKLESKGYIRKAGESVSVEPVMFMMIKSMTGAEAIETAEKNGAVTYIINGPALSVLVETYRFSPDTFKLTPFPDRDSLSRYLNEEV